MDRCLTLGLLLVLCALASNTVMAGEDCKEEKLSKCVSTLQHLTLNVLDAIKNAGGESNYCQTLEKEGNCPNNKAFKDCKAKFPKKASLASSLHLYLSSFCNDKGKILKAISPCFRSHTSAFEKCWPQQKTNHSHNGTDPICKEMKSMQCLAKVEKEKCENGKEIGSSVEKSVNSLKMDLKCGSATLVNDFRILAVALLSLLLMRNKMY